MCFDIVYLIAPGTTIEGSRRVRAQKLAKGYGGNAVGAARTIAALEGKTDLVCPAAQCELGPGFVHMAERAGIRLIHCDVPKFQIPISAVASIGPERAILTGPNVVQCASFPSLDPRRYRFVHLDGHFGDHAVQCAHDFRAAGVLTSVDAGRNRPSMKDLLRFTDVAVVSDDFCTEMEMSDPEMLDFLQYDCRCKIGGVTRGDKGMLWFDEGGVRHRMHALHVDGIVDTTNAGDIFHGAYLASWQKTPGKPWAEHFEYARAASAHSIRFLGINESLPRPQDVVRARETFPIRMAA